MGWVTKINTSDFVCLEQHTKQLSVRIESRKTEEGWIIYRSHVSPQGLNHTEEFIAQTEDKMNKIIEMLQREKVPTAKEVEQLILQKSRKVTVQIERDYKEYGVEKWRFGINNSGLHNVVFVRCCEEVDMDFFIHERYKSHEQYVIKELISMLGFEGMEDVLNAHCYYFNQHKKVSLPVRQKFDADIGIDLL